jgi:hypothetical protein
MKNYERQTHMIFLFQSLYNTVKIVDKICIILFNCTDEITVTYIITHKKQTYEAD